jgi:PiT family inorganic phosphate transporter
LAGAALWVLIATRAALPVSTTHALVGSLIGAAVAAYGTSGIAWSALGAKVAAPLILSPLVSLMIAVLISRGARRLTAVCQGSADCMCVHSTAAPDLQWAAGPGGTAILSSTAPPFSIVSADAATCRAAMPTALRVTGDDFHWLSSGAASFARGLNDAPKIVGVAIAAGALTATSIAAMTPVFFLLVTAGIVIGSLAAGRRVTRVLAEDVTPMSHREGLAANLVTAMLVSVGAVNGLPMSTTHVSSGAIMGIGAERGSLSWRTTRTIVAAWVVTLPAAALLAAACYAAARMVTS